MGNLSSACESCFGQPKNTYKSSLDLTKRRRRGQTKDSTEEELEKEDEKLLSQDYASADHHLKIQKNEGEAKTKKNISLNDFNLIRILGQGAFGKVYLVQKKKGRKFYALKALKKKDLILENLLTFALNERNILKDIQNPFVVQLKYAFQSASRIYMVMDFCPGGDLYAKIKKEGPFDEKTAKFYAAEIILGIQYLHEKLNIIHRDIKPENILLASDGHVKITDFGLAKTSSKALTLCGTPDYLAPEIIKTKQNKPYTQVVDWWSLGCLIYEMLTGHAPFGQGNLMLVDSIVKEEPRFPSNFSKQAKDLISGLLKKNAAERLGSKGAEQIKKHAFFKDVDWNAVFNKELTPPFRVAFTTEETTTHKKDTSNMSILATPSIDPMPSRKDHKDHKMNHPEFAMFSYVGGDGDNFVDLQTK